MTSAQHHHTPDLSIIVPTLNEKDNIEPIIKKLSAALTDIQWELLFVDDNSPDNTAEKIERFARNDSRIRYIKRLNRRGLSSACIEGFLATSAPFVAVMDADLQHDETLIPTMLKAVDSKQCDIAIGSRYIASGNNHGLSTQRSLISRFAIHLSRFLKIETLSDPVSGFFLFRRSSFTETFPHLYGQGYKILIDLMSSTNQPITAQEFPYAMRPRRSGDSKLELLIILQYLTMLFMKLTGNRIPIQFMLFLLVGSSGVAIHISTLAALQAMGMTHFILAQSLATFVAMTTNFLLNNSITYRDQRLQGNHLLLGLISFYIVCSIGALINISFANMLEQLSFSWIFCGASGAAVGAIWNYTMTSVFTWTKKHPELNGSNKSST